MCRYFVLEADNWQINFQDPATPIAERIIQIHHHVFFFLLIVLIFVVYNIYSILETFSFTIPQVVKFVDETKDVISKWNVNAIRAYLRQLSKVNLTHNTIIEVIWTSIPSFILVLIAIPSFGLLYAMDDMMDPEITVKAIGNQWYWNYEYSDYVEKSAELKSIDFDSYMVPEDELSLGYLRLLEVDNTVILPTKVFIRVNITATDVLHSWAIPSLGIKADAVPHRINSVFMYIQRPGVYYGQCSEICGVNHGFMPIVIKAVDMDSYLLFLNNNI
jgi:cytochrome c oxidase subunit 2